MHISKHDGETNPNHWLEDYCQGMKAEGSNDDFHYLVPFPASIKLDQSLARAARARQHPLLGDYRSVFIGHF
jgi:hypothetical protein